MAYPTPQFDALTITSGGTVTGITASDVAAIPAASSGVASGVATLDSGAHLNPAQFPALTGPVTTTAGSLATTIAASGVTAGSYGDSTHVASVTLGADGRATGASSVAIAFPTNTGTFVYPWPALKSTQYHIAGMVNSGALTTFAIAANTAYAVPFSVPRTTTVTALFWNITVNATGDSAAGIYSDSAGSPNTLLVGGAQLPNVAGFNPQANSITLNPGTIYWAVFGGTAAITVTALSAGLLGPGLGSSGAAAIPATGMTFSLGTWTGFPSTAPASTIYTGTIPAVYFDG